MNFSEKIVDIWNVWLKTFCWTNTIFLFMQLLQSLDLCYEFCKEQFNFAVISEHMKTIPLFQHPYFIVVGETCTFISQYIFLFSHPVPCILICLYPILSSSSTWLQLHSLLPRNPSQSQVYVDVRHFLYAIFRNRLLQDLYAREMA